MAQVAGLRDQISAVTTVNTSNPLNNLWTAMHTTALNSDGTVGTADSGSPVSTNPIDPRVYPSIQRVVKASDANNALGVLGNILAACNGQAVAADASVPQKIGNVTF